MKKTLILAAFGLLASLAPPAFASDSLGTYIDIKAGTTLNQQTVKESSTTFVIAKRDYKAKNSPGIATTAKSTDTSTFRGEKDFYVRTAYDSAPAKLGAIMANKDTESSCAMPKLSVGLDLKTTPMTSASAQGASTIAGAEANFTT